MKTIADYRRGEFKRLIDSIRSDAEQLPILELHRALRQEIRAAQDEAFDVVTQERARFRAQLYADVLSERQNTITRR